MKKTRNGQGAMANGLSEQILTEIKRLGGEDQRRVLEFARALKVARPAGVPGKELLRFAGTISKEDLKQMKAAIQVGCERLDRDGW